MTAERSSWEIELTAAVEFLNAQADDLVTLFTSTPRAELGSPALAPTLLLLRAAACTTTAVFWLRTRSLTTSRRRQHE